VVSLTGGLLSLPRVFDGGSQVKLMFVTDAGPLLTPVELLRPVSWGQQAFRFSGMCEADQHRLHSAIQRWRGETINEDWIAKYRAAVMQQQPAENKFAKLIVAAAALSALCACGLLYRMM
jgi:hypothetical protein